MFNMLQRANNRLSEVGLFLSTFTDSFTGELVMIAHHGDFKGTKDAVSFHKFTVTPAWEDEKSKVTSYVIGTEPDLDNPNSYIAFYQSEEYPADSIKIALAADKWVSAVMEREDRQTMRPIITQPTRVQSLMERC